jgi:hypothetical protein
VGNDLSGYTDFIVYQFAGYLRHQKIQRNGLKLVAGFKYRYINDLRHRALYPCLPLYGLKAERPKV